MKIFITSDWHCEFGLSIPYLIDNYTPDQSEYDVMVMAGDFSIAGYIKQDLRELCTYIEKPIIFVPGNHEYYSNGKYSIEEINHWIDEIEWEFENLHTLNRDYVCIDDICFGGCVGWMDGSFSMDMPEENKENIEFSISDFTQTTDMTYSRCVEMGERDKEFLRDCYIADVVVTHNAPSMKSLAPQFIGSRNNPFFVNDWSDVIEEVNPKLWIHGHTHNSFDYKEYNTRVICNPIGYITGREKTGYDKYKIVGV